MVCFKRLSSLKIQAVFFILKLLIKLVYTFISQNTKKSRFYENSTLFWLISMDIPNNHNSRQENASLLRYQRRPVTLSHNFALCDYVRPFKVNPISDYRVRPFG